MFTIERTRQYDEWINNLKDKRARARIIARIDRLAQGNAGDHKNLGGGLSELRIPYGKGMRVYYARHGERIYLLLGGGDKSTQPKDIEVARKVLETAREEQS